MVIAKCILRYSIKCTRSCTPWLQPENISCIPRRVEDVFSITLFRLPRRLEDMFSTSSPRRMLAWFCKVDYELGVKYFFFFTFLCIFKCFWKWNLRCAQVYNFLLNRFLHCCTLTSGRTKYATSSATKFLSQVHP